jgi:hypothetical protein
MTDEREEAFKKIDDQEKSIIGKNIKLAEYPNK